MSEPHKFTVINTHTKEPITDSFLKYEIVRAAQQQMDTVNVNNSTYIIVKIENEDDVHTKIYISIKGK